VIYVCLIIDKLYDIKPSCLFDSVVTRINFELIDYVTLILCKSELNVNRFMFGYDLSSEDG